jgi:hypothetical protein
MLFSSRLFVSVEIDEYNMENFSRQISPIRHLYHIKMMEKEETVMKCR